MVASAAKTEGDATIRGLRDLLNGLKRIDAPKTLILMSEGFVMDDRSPEVDRARRARVGVADVDLRAEARRPGLRRERHARPPTARGADRVERSAGLETLAGAARGALFTVSGSGTAVFDRIASELSGYYLIGVEAEPRDREGKPRSVRVEVGRKGATVRARRQIFPSAAEDRAATVAARRGDGRPDLAAHPVRAAAARRELLAARSGSRKGADSHPRRRRRRLYGVEAGVARLHDHRCGGTARRQPRRRCAARAAR